MKVGDPTIAGLLKAQGCTTGRFGKNHLGDRDEMLPRNFERAEHESIGYSRWWVDHMFAFAPAGAHVGQWLQSFRELPPRQKPGSFNLDCVMEAVMHGEGDK
jgi:arylsulfatase A-like enzyme